MAKKAAGTALINIEEQLRADAAIARATVESIQTGQFFGTKAGVLTFNGAPIKENKMEIIAIDSVLANVFYPEKYNSSDPKPPTCYAFGRNDKELLPHEKASDKQAEKCQGCPQNEWGTADTGRGKACKNGSRIGCISASLLEKPNDIADAPVAFLSVPVTSMKGWAGYVRQVEGTFGLPPYGVITEVSLVADAKDQFKMVFRCVERITDKRALAALVEKRAVVSKDIGFPFPELEEGAPRKPARGAAKRKKPVNASRPAPAPTRAAPAKGGKAAAAKPAFGAARKF